MHLDLNKNHVKLEVFLKECGLISISEKDIFHFILKEVPFLKLIDKQKWFLAKIKYGI